MKTLGILTMFAAGVSVYVYARHPAERPRLFHRTPSSEVAPAATSSRDIIVAPFKGGTIDERWQNSSSRP